MKKKKKIRTSWIYKLPLWLAGFQAAFWAIFALDVLGEYQGVELVVALFIHLVPTWILLMAMWVAGKKREWGGWLFLGLGMASAIFFKTYQDLIVFLLVSGPVLATGILFWLFSGEKVDEISG